MTHHAPPPASPAPDAVLTALALPAQALADQRIPKTLLLEHGTPTSADKRLIEASVAELRWNAALRPDTVAIPAHDTATHAYPEVQVMTLTRRALKPDSAGATRLRELIHRAIPYPLLLLDADQESTWLSLAPKRRSQAQEGAVVLEHDLQAIPLAASPFLAPLLAQLPPSVRPFADLRDLYAHWQAALLSWQIAAMTGQFRLYPQPDPLRQPVQDYARLERELTALRRAAGREKSLARRAELTLKARAVAAQQEEVRQLLLNWPTG